MHVGLQLPFITVELHEAVIHAPGSGASSPCWSVHALCCGRLPEKQPLHMPHTVHLYWPSMPWQTAELVKER